MRRNTVIAMALRKTRSGAGSRASLLRERTAVYGTPPLRFLEGVAPFVVVGGLATRRYMPERMTLDTDILVQAGDRHKVEKALRRAGYHRLGGLSIGGSTWMSKDRRPLDLLALDAPWVADAVSRPVAGDDGLPVVALPYLVLMKMDSARMQDLADVSRMLGAATAAELRAVRAVMSHYRPQDREDLESLIRLGRLEHTRK